MLRRSVTQQYPEVKPDLPPRSRGVIALVEENCTSCMLCARECPDWCIYIDSHKETIPAPEGGRARQRNVLDRFAIDFSLCMYCGICIEVCPFDALFWSPEFEYAEGDIRNLVHEKDQLVAWTQTVPPPPAHDPGAEPPKELTAAPRRPAPDRSPRPPADRGTGPSADRPSRPASDRGTGPSADRPSRPATQGVSGPATEQPASPSAEQPTSAEPAGTEPAGTGAEPTDRTPARDATSEQTSAGATTTPTGAEAADDAARTGPTAHAQEAKPTTNAPGEGPQTPAGPTGRPQRERRPMSNVRGIRPPGALPDRSEGEAVTGEAGGHVTGEAGEHVTGEAEEQSQGPASSTGDATAEKLSTASADPQPRPEPEEQTSAASPRRRKMADPRSIRPPGRLGPDETRESEEES
ncbi:4Fe-4S binding protein [Nonomuraea sp. NBC_00507]|uniref:4Fe-4S binding protein n=1 Tax=Nonomuraea sp. NBC_00507 TaxID=2976002 RepID=UPI002E1946F9